MDLIEHLTFSQEERPHTHLVPRKIAGQTGFIGLKTLLLSEGTRNERETRAGSLRERFESNIRMIAKTIWQDYKDFTLEVSVILQNDRVYGRGKKSDIPYYLVQQIRYSKKPWHPLQFRGLVLPNRLL